MSTSDLEPIAEGVSTLESVQIIETPTLSAKRGRKVGTKMDLHSIQEGGFGGQKYQLPGDSAWQF